MVSTEISPDGRNGVAAHSETNKGPEHLSALINRLKTLPERFKSIRLPIQDSEGKEYGIIVFFAPVITGEQRPVSTFVVVDQNSGIWGISFDRNNKDKADKTAEIYLQEALSYHLRSREPLVGKVTVTANNGTLIELAGKTYEMKQNSGNGIVARATYEQATEAFNESVKTVKENAIDATLAEEIAIARRIDEEINNLLKS